MKYIVYKTTNLINGKTYIGVHKTNDLEDGYMGSGIVLRRAIDKYGIENFRKDIIYIFDKSTDMFDMESILVDEDFVKRTDTYNLKTGGHGGFDFINDNNKKYKMTKEEGEAQATLARKGFDKKLKEDPEFRKNLYLKISKGLKIYYKTHDNKFKGCKHSEETKKQMSNSHKGKHTGSKNSQFGSMWITNGTENRKIKKDITIPEGWNKGRKI